ncbi:MAG: hypothetical protein KJO07_07810, partial [Deltaproteobacteria bacterium]|nr:hypothetical protein [Deltaproteobacteria bacterium]
IRLTAEANGWSKHGPRLISRFLDGYKDALGDPKLTPPTPTVAARFLGSFREDRLAALDAADELMAALDFPLAELQAAIDRYAKPLAENDPKLGGAFFKVKRAGNLHIGIGSALDSKYLLRVEGPSPSPQDDVVLEVKEVRKLDAIPCLNSSWTNDPFRILVGSARIAYRPFRYLGYTVFKDQAYWVHAWTDNYFQVQADRSFQSVKELDGLVYDAGVQLGRGHPYLVATPLDTQLRQALLAQLDRLRGKLEREIVVLAELTKQAWISFSIVVTSKR